MTHATVLATRLSLVKATALPVARCPHVRYDTHVPHTRPDICRSGAEVLQQVLQDFA